VEWKLALFPPSQGREELFPNFRVEPSQPVAEKHILLSPPFFSLKGMPRVPVQPRSIRSVPSFFLVGDLSLEDRSRFFFFLTPRRRLKRRARFLPLLERRRTPLKNAGHFL